MKVTRQKLIELCDQFLVDRIDKVTIQDFASASIADDAFDDVDDEILANTLFEWDTEDLYFEINKTNIMLWKQRLLTGKDDLIEHNIWNSHIDKQRALCKAHKSIWNPINKKLSLAISANLDKDPISGLRLPAENGTTGWFIWTGEYSEAHDFFQPMSAEDLLQQRPALIKYLGLDIGFRFLVDSNGHEDIWFDEELKT